MKWLAVLGALAVTALMLALSLVTMGDTNASLGGVNHSHLGGPLGWVSVDTYLEAPARFGVVA
jgi:hypothetical protein